MTSLKRINPSKRILVESARVVPNEPTIIKREDWLNKMEKQT